MADDRQKGKPRVTVCLPVAAGAPGLQDVLNAVRAQSAADTAVAISVDGPDEVAETLCAAAAEEPHVAWSVRPEPLGRVGNLNHLLFHADTEFALLLPPGVLPEPDCLSRLIAALDDTPEAVLADGDLAPAGRSRKSPRPGVAAIGADPVLRLLAVLSGMDAAQGVCGLIRTSALVPAGRLREDASGDYLAEVTLAAQLARHGALIRVPAPLFRRGTSATSTDKPDGDAGLQVWWHHCADMTEAALAAPASAQEIRLLWLAGVARLLSPSLSAPVLGREAFTAGQREALITGFLARMEASDKVDIPWLLDEDWERIRRWTRGFAWSPREKNAITEFGPQPVNAGQAFNPQSGGASAVWVKTEGRLPPGTRIRLGGRTLETETDLNMATAVVPSEVTAGSGELPLVLVDADGSVRSNQMTFWVLRASALGRSVVKMLRRLRGQPDPAAPPALPPPSKKR